MTTPSTPIDATMSVTALCALEAECYLRLAQAQIAGDDDLAAIEAECRHTYRQIADALYAKYPAATSLCERIEILERLSIIGRTIHSHHADFAIAEAAALKTLHSLAGMPGEGLTYAQKLRLSWIPTVNAENESQIVAKLLESLSTDYSLHEQSANAITSFLTPNSSFIMATISQIIDDITPAERELVFDKYITLLTTLPPHAGRAGEGSNGEEANALRTLSIPWQIYPTFRARMQRVRKMNNEQ